MSDFKSRLLRAMARLLALILPAKWRAVALLLAANPPPTPRGRVSVTVDGEVENLKKIEHIVVVMLENRSFDHMLGYLSLNGRHDVDGLTGSESNTAPDGSIHAVHRLGSRTAFAGEAEDPDHSGASVDEQLANDNGGFVANFAKHSRGVAEKLKVPVPDPGLVMGYYTDEQLPVYDFLAREYCVCDRWFSSLPGATWPNRLYAVAGRAQGSRDDLGPPLYALPAFVRHLDAVEKDWRWYSFDPGTLRCVDPAYRFSKHHHFAFVDKRKLSIDEELVGHLTEAGNSFLEDAAAGSLPAVSWIDPRFKDLRVLGPDSNDDHPPSDVTAGQHLALSVYHALRAGPAWEKTLLIFTYDEHGGFYDHVSPPPAPAVEPGFDRYGVRVPALVVSPWVQAGGVAETERNGVKEKLVFDHTSIIKTILLRNCLDADGRIPDMGARVNAAEHLGGLLTRETPREDADIGAYGQLAQSMLKWASELQEGRFAEDFSPPSPPRPLTEFQNGFYGAARLLRRAGLRAGHP
jgi:phospholipase C